MNIELNWHSPTLADIKFLFENIDTENLFSNDCSLANLFLLQNRYETKIAITDNFLFRYFNGNKSRSGYLFPIKLKTAKCANYKTAFSKIAFDAKQNRRKLKFCLVPQNMRDIVSEYFCVNWDTNRDDSDYVYFTEELANLNGKIYHKKKNHVQHFMNKYGEKWNFVTAETDDAWVDILTVAENWLNEQNAPSDFLYEEFDAIKNAVKYHDELKLKGALIYVDENPVAMTVASIISSQVLDVNFEKALFDYANEGAYSAINYYFARSVSNFLYLNREEDLGYEGLRKSKLSYKPEIILDKFFGEI